MFTVSMLIQELEFLPALDKKKKESIRSKIYGTLTVEDSSTAF